MSKKNKKFRKAPTQIDPADLIARFLVIIGSVSLGVLGAFGNNPIQQVFVKMPTLLQIIYTLIGFAGLYELWVLFGKK